MSLRLYTTTDEEVRWKSAELSAEQLSSSEMQQFVDELVQAMIDANGIGIAAIQVGRPLQIFVVDKEYAGSKEHLILVNPRIVSTSTRVASMEEGCLSVPAVFGPVERPIKVRVKALLRDGSPIDIKAKGMYARILQHELDHLQAILFIDHAPKTRKIEA